MAFNNQRVAVIIPAYNEEQSIGNVVEELASLCTVGSSVVDDIIVCDNGSTDSTAVIAKSAGAIVVQEFRKGYGSACLAGLRTLHSSRLPAPDFVIFVDADHSVRVEEVIDLLDKLHNGYDLVVGSRENKNLQPGAMGYHQRFGNVLASFLIRFLWKQPVSDLGPFRGMRYSSLLLLDMQDARFGWTVEMQVKTIQAGFNYTEVPVTTFQRIGVSKISGTVRGTVGAAIGIFSKVFQLYFHEAAFVESVKHNRNRPTNKLAINTYE